jgi:hypothetical protein
MGKPTTHVLMVTDESGSMEPLEDDVRGGFNRYVDDLRNDVDSKYRLTVALFNHAYRPVCVAAKLADVPKLDGQNYRPGGMTALVDAIGRTIADFETRVPNLAEGDRVLLVVQTDGQENSSKEYTTESVRKLIADREAGGRWSCLFLGAGPDAWQQAGGLGFDRGSTFAVAHSTVGTQSSYAGLTRATRSYSRGATGAEASRSVADALQDDPDA